MDFYELSRTGEIYDEKYKHIFAGREASGLASVFVFYGVLILLCCVKSRWRKRH
jgi:hypothetical protein